MTNSRSNAPKAWFLASRPKTLTGALAPVAVALAAIWHDKGELQAIPSVLCALFAVLMQIDANFVNDYFDCKDGIDTDERLGPKRACSQGWITLPAMKTGICITTILSALVGLPLVLWGGWQMIGVGIACIIFTFLYTTLLSRYAMGDVLVLVFFGIVPVTCTYYLQTYTVTPYLVQLALAQGIITDCLLLVNNFRDRDTDRKCGKITLVTLIGERATLLLYLLIGPLAVLLVITDITTLSIREQMLPVAVFLLLHLFVWRRMKAIKKGKALNGVLAMSALSIMIFAVFVSLLLVF